MNDPVVGPVRSGVPQENHFVSAEHLSKEFKLGANTVRVLKDVSFVMDKGEWVALVGASGSGKTTLLDIMGTISRPDAGDLRIAGTDVRKLSNRSAVEFRRKMIGFVFQAYHMLPELNVIENIMLPALLNGASSSETKKKAFALIEKVGLTERAEHRPNELSGGEQQRAAIARALINDPQIILADEPTGNLDSQTGEGILDLFRQIHFQGVSILMVTHDRHVAELADRIIELKDGSIL